jgi:tetratricopeptide (TPR) repeat protein
MAGAYEGLNRFDEARSIAEEGQAKKLGGTGVHFVLTDLAYMHGDKAGADRQLEAAKGTGDEPFVLFFNAGWQVALGKLNASQDFWQQARKAAINEGAKDFASQLQAVQAYDDALFGNLSRARQEVAEALKDSADSDTRWGAAQALATIGDEQKSAALLSGLQHDVPENHFIQTSVIPMVRAIGQVQSGQFADAIASLEALRPYEFGTGPRAVGVTPAYWRGIAYLKMKDGAKAAAEFHRLLDHRGAASWAPEYPLSQLNLARAYVLTNDMPKARTAYQDFFALWKDADPDIPVLKAARAEYDKLK